MTEMQNDLIQSVPPQSKPKNRSTGALILFLVFAIPMNIIFFPCLLEIKGPKSIA